MTPQEEEERGRNEPLWRVLFMQRQDRLEFLLDRTGQPRYVVRAVGACWGIWDRREQRYACGRRMWDSPEAAHAYAQEMMETAELEREGERGMSTALGVPWVRRLRAATACVVDAARAYRVACDRYDAAGMAVEQGQGDLTAMEEAGTAMDKARAVLFGALEELERLEEEGR